MTVQVEITNFTQLHEFSWGGAREVLARIAQAGKEKEAFDYLESILDDCFQEGVTDTGLNDLIWFDLLDMLAEAGIYLED